jgi:surface polysaccharide O-acyltransferase-like enzyme
MAFTAQIMDESAPAWFGWRLGAALGFVFACASACFSAFSLFMRFATTRLRIADSLSDNAYGMYLIHYVFVVWLQYALLTAPLLAIVKAGIVFGVTLALSWAASAAIRCVPFGARLIGERRAVAKAS